MVNEGRKADNFQFLFRICTILTSFHFIIIHFNLQSCFVEIIFCMNFLSGLAQNGFRVGVRHCRVRKKRWEPFFMFSINNVTGRETNVSVPFRQRYHICNHTPSIQLFDGTKFRSICIIWARGFYALAQHYIATWGKTKKWRRSPTRSFHPKKITHSFCLIWIHDELISRIWLLLLHCLSFFLSHSCSFWSSWMDKHEEKISFTSVKSNIINIRAQIVFLCSLSVCLYRLLSSYNNGMWGEGRGRRWETTRGACVRSDAIQFLLLNVDSVIDWFIIKKNLKQTFRL